MRGRSGSFCSLPKQVTSYAPSFIGSCRRSKSQLCRLHSHIAREIKQEGCCRICRSRRIVLQQPLLYDNRLFVLHSKTLLKAIDTAARVYQLLLSGEERMALCANFHADVLLCGTGMNHIAASASNGCLFIFRMNCFLHSFHPFRHNRIINIGIISYRHSKCKQFSAVFFNLTATFYTMSKYFRNKFQNYSIQSQS